MYALDMSSQFYYTAMRLQMHQEEFKAVMSKQPVCKAIDMTWTLRTLKNED